MRYNQNVIYMDGLTPVRDSGDNKDGNDSYLLGKMASNIESIIKGNDTILSKLDSHDRRIRNIENQGIDKTTIEKIHEKIEKLEGKQWKIILYIVGTASATAGVSKLVGGLF